MILPRSGRTACVLRSRPCLAEPPAESPSTRKISRNCGSRSEQSASFAASPSSSRPPLRVSSRALEGLEIALRLGVARDLARERRAETRQVRPAFARVDVVGEGEDVLLVAVVVLQRHLDLDVVLLALEEEHLGMNGCLVLVQVF